MLSVPPAVEESRQKITLDTDAGVIRTLVNGSTCLLAISGKTQLVKSRDDIDEKFLANSSALSLGELSGWSSWGTCSASCQLDYTLPTKTSTRTCLRSTFGGNCNNQALNQTQNCNAEEQYRIGVLGVRVPTCNNLVNIPFQTRSRSCIGFSTWDPKYSGCPDITTSDQQTCNVNVGCAGTYGAWSGWSSCSETCQSNPALNPFQTQTRQCLGATLGGTCAGPSSQTMTCNSGVPCPGVLSGWSAWGACSALCQLDYTVPTQTSTRTCLGPF
ncbi:hemicentin-1-like [Hydra vulgaris]|uniref:Hemicentin-1-like n=1 Tax=Hydra vulgaris TaxID=6087 RepID=A0ABM4CMM3_HYDVU